ncbi:MAG: NosD domain-containing protein, partial [Candidatus Hodarchaeales archaeon]
MEGNGKNHRVLIGSVSLASAVVLVTVSIGPSLLFDGEKTPVRNNTKQWDIIVPDDFNTIQEAIENAQSDYRIFVRSGSYRTSDSFFNKPISIDKQGLTIQGENKETTIINGRNIKNIVIINANFVNFSGFTIKEYYENGSSIIINSDHCTINDNILVGENYYEGTEYCIRVDRGDKNTISNNTIFGTDNGIELSGCNRNIIENNTIKENFDGIEIENIYVR